MPTRLVTGALVFQLACIALAAGTLALIPRPDQERERVMVIESDQSVDAALTSELAEEVESQPVVATESPADEIVAIVRALGVFGVQQQMIDWARQWDLARKVEGALVMRQLDLAQRTATAAAELRKIRELEQTCDTERMAWRKVEADIVHRSMRMKLSELETTRDELEQKFVESSVWMKRAEALVAALARRLKGTPRELEVERVMVADPTREWLRARRSQVEIELEGLEAQTEVVATHLQAARAKLGEYRRLAAHLLSLLEVPGAELPDPENFELPPLQ